MIIFLLIANFFALFYVLFMVTRLMIKFNIYSENTKDSLRTEVNEVIKKDNNESKVVKNVKKSPEQSMQDLGFTLEEIEQAKEKAEKFTKDVQEKMAKDMNWVEMSPPKKKGKRDVKEKLPLTEASMEPPVYSFNKNEEKILKSLEKHIKTKSFKQQKDLIKFILKKSSTPLPSYSIVKIVSYARLVLKITYTHRRIKEGSLHIHDPKFVNRIHSFIGYLVKKYPNNFQKTNQGYIWK